MPSTPEQRARRKAQRETARRVHAREGYKPVLRQQTQRARDTRSEYVQAQRSYPRASLERLRTDVRKHKRDTFGEDIKFRGRGSDDAIHKYPAPIENYQEALRAHDEDLRDLAAQGKYDDGWKFLYYH